MRKLLIIEMIALIICAFIAFLLAALFVDFTANDNLQIKILGIRIEMSVRQMVLILWLISVFTINSLRQIKLKYNNVATNLVLLLVSLRLLYAVISELASVNRLKQVVLENAGNYINLNNFIIALWSLLVLLIITVIVTIFYFQNVIKQRLSVKK